MGDAAVLATAVRGSAPELVIRGHVAVVDARGAAVGGAGDPGSVTTLRSCVKPLQALPFVRSALADVGAGEPELAVACSSHSGEPEHVATVRRLLERAGVDESALACGPHLPFDAEAARQVVLDGGPRAVHNNCSGKHAAMLATCSVQGWPLPGYRDRGHPCQRAVTAAMAEWFDTDLETAPWGVDGCGLPTFGLPLRTIAAAFARAQADPAFTRCRRAMAAAPHLVAGTGRFDTALLAAAGARVTGKSGGAAVWAAAVDEGIGIAVKLEAGAADGLSAVACAVLRRLGALKDEPLLAPFENPQVRNWEGAVVGEVVAEPGALNL